MALIKDKIKQQNKEEYAYKKMLSYGWTPDQASGIVGNLMRESNLNTTILGTADTKGSRGIAQWHSGRLETLQKKYGSNWTDLDNQLDFVNWELNNTHKKAGDKLRTAQGVYNTGRIVSDDYERPKVKFHADIKRQNLVYNTYKKLSGIPLTEQDQADMLQGTAQRAIDNYQASLKPTENTLTVNAPQVINLVQPIEIPNLAQEKGDLQVQQAKDELDYKQQQQENQQKFIQDLLTASQVQYVDPNQVQDYTQYDTSSVFQAGGLKATDYTKYYLKSPKYSERLKSSGYSDPNLVVKERLNKLNSVNTVDQEGKLNILEQMWLKINNTPYSPDGSAYFPDSNTIVMDSLTDQKSNHTRGIGYEGVKAHELAHAEVAGFDLNDKDKSELFNRQKVYKIGEDLSVKERDEIRRRNPNEISHDLRPEENKADLNALRFLLKQGNIYDAGKENLNKEHLKKLKSSFIKDRLLRNYEEDDLIWLMNNIAHNDNQEPVYYGQNGGIIQDQQGQRKYPWQVTEIKGNTMSTSGYGNIPLFVVPNVGEPKIIQANTGEYKFPGATKFTEYPIKINLTSNSQDYVEKYQQGGTVAEQYESLTNKPWSTARQEGLTNGTAEQNIALINSLKKVNPKQDNGEATSFNDAFKQAREQLGANKIFEYKGRKYGTNVEGEKFTPSDEEIAKNKLPVKETKNRLEDQNKQVGSIYTSKNTVKLEPEYKDWEKIKKRNDEINAKANADKIIKYQSDKPDEKYIVVDKKSGKMHLYQGVNEITSYNVGTGENAGDEQTRTFVDKETKKVDWTKGNKSTGAGTYTITTSTAKNKHYGNVPSFNMQNEHGIEVPMAIHAAVSDNRVSKISDKDNTNNRVSNGCINGLCNDLKDLYKQDIKKGTKVYVLPDDKNNEYVYENGKLNFKSKNSNVNRTVNTLKYKPVKIEINEKEFKDKVFQWNDFNDEKEYEKTTKPFVKALQDNKQTIMKVAKINGDVYNEIAKTAFGIYGTESNFGDTHSAIGNLFRATNKVLDRKSSSSPDYKAKASTYGASDDGNSVGLTQIRFSYLNPDEKNALKQVGITKNTDFLDPKKAAIGTAVVLGIRYNQQLTPKEKKDILTNLPKKWNNRENYPDRVKTNSSYLKISQLE